MFKDVFLKMAIRKYLKKLNNKLLKDVYFNFLKKNPSLLTHIDNVYKKECLSELKRRGLM